MTSIILQWLRLGLPFVLLLIGNDASSNDSKSARVLALSGGLLSHDRLVDQVCDVTLRVFDRAGCAHLSHLRCRTHRHLQDAVAVGRVLVYFLALLNLVVRS